MFQLLLFGALILISQSTINGRLPDAIHCGGDNTEFSGAIFIIHTTKQYDKLIYYIQVISLEHRYVGFNINGTYHHGGGSFDSRKGCEGKSLQTLDKEGRTIYYALDTSMHKNQTKLNEENAIKNRIAKLEEREIIKDKKISKLEEENIEMKRKMAKTEQQEAIKDKKIEKLQSKISELKKKLQSFSANFWDYEQIKQTWVKDFKREMLTDIKEKGLQIGSR